MKVVSALLLETPLIERSSIDKSNVDAVTQEVSFLSYVVLTPLLTISAMLSYHNVLAVFGKSVKDRTLECDCDLHPWETRINDELWPAKIRLIGFVDVFFLISYTADISFLGGIIVFKNPDDIKELRNEANFPGGEDTTSSPNTEKQEDGTQKKDDGNRLKFSNDANYRVTSWGHEIGHRLSYKRLSVAKYDITITKPYHRALRRQIKRGLREHSTKDLLDDMVRCGVIFNGQKTGEYWSRYFAGGLFDDTIKKYMDEVANNRPGHVELSNETSR